MGKKGLQFVWPKDGHKGRSGNRGFFGGLNDIMTGKGPDIFIQQRGSRMAIRPEFWGNWQAHPTPYHISIQREVSSRYGRDSYHYPEYHRQELGRSYQNGLFSASRGTQRYDPASRTYKEWSIPHDWHRQRINEQGQACYPRFTREEARKMIRRLQQHRPINARSMGSEWTVDGPRRFQQEYDWFWQQAHRIGENLREGFPALSSDINTNFSMSQRWPDELREWIVDEPWYPRI